ncbi:MAG: coproporphyrinogen III oxidase, partial [Planctomycetales bacterium]|nr:coproporphyrinogen III oxidase [Planctomycetales bacterium]
GMVGETWDNWKDNVRKAIDLGPDSVTIYQMELPYNTVYSQGILGDGQSSPVADWPTKRAWVDYAFNEFVAAGYSISSAYTVVRDPEKVKFSYRDNLWRGSDLLATGVASFGHISGVHYQNAPDWETYTGPIEAGELPITRALQTTPRQRLIREMMLQLKTGRLDAGAFREKFGVEILDEWQAVWDAHREAGWLSVDGDAITLTREGLLRVDALLPPFFEPENRDVRYP